MCALFAAIFSMGPHEKRKIVWIVEDPATRLYSKLHPTIDTF